MQQSSAQRRPRPKASDKGDYKLAVYFIDHRQPHGKPYYFYSKKSQDKAGTAANRLKQLVFSTNFKDKVNWAGLYHTGTLIATYKREDNQWQRQ